MTIDPHHDHFPHRLVLLLLLLLTTTDRGPDFAIAAEAFDQDEPDTIDCNDLLLVIPKDNTAPPRLVHFYESGIPSKDSTPSRLSTPKVNKAEGHRTPLVLAKDKIFAFSSDLEPTHTKVQAMTLQKPTWTNENLTWTNISATNHNRAFAGVAFVDKLNKLIACGCKGKKEADQWKCADTCEVLDVSSEGGKWVIENVETGGCLRRTGAVAYKDTIVLAGGSCSHNESQRNPVHGRVWIRQLSRHKTWDATWTSPGVMLKKRQAPLMAVVNDTILICGGLDDANNLLKTCEKFNPKTGESIEAPNLPDDAKEDFEAVHAIGGRLMFVHKKTGFVIYSDKGNNKKWQQSGVNAGAGDTAIIPAKFFISGCPKVDQTPETPTDETDSSLTITILIALACVGGVVTLLCWAFMCIAVVRAREQDIKKQVRQTMMTRPRTAVCDAGPSFYTGAGTPQVSRRIDGLFPDESVDNPTQLSISNEAVKM